MAFRRLATLLLLAAAFPPAAGSAQARWFAGGEAGGYDIHDGTRMELGPVVGAFAGRRWDTAALELALRLGLGTDAFTALEPSLRVEVPAAASVQLLLGAGGGLMLEEGASLSLTYFVNGGAGLRLNPRTTLRLLLRAGAHANAGDPGTSGGPRTFTVGLVRSL